MNRYPLWKYILIVVALLFGTLYTLPNFFGESPAVQVSSAVAIWLGIKREDLIKNVKDVKEKGDADGAVV